MTINSNAEFVPEIQKTLEKEAKFLQRPSKLFRSERKL